jgi:hypothetical protein
MRKDYKFVHEFEDFALVTVGRLFFLGFVSCYLLNKSLFGNHANCVLE